MHPAIEYIQERRSAFVEELKGFLRIPCVSTKSEHKADMLKAAQWLVEQMRGMGLEHVEILPTAGHPVVYADWLHAAGNPTVLLYGHYDVHFVHGPIARLLPYDGLSIGPGVMVSL